MSISDVEHFATMISGCESLTEGDENSGDAKYAKAVLALYDPEEKDITGVEAWSPSFFQSAKSWLHNPLGALPKFAKVNKEINQELNPIAESVFGSYLQSVADTFHGENRTVVKKAQNILKSLDSPNWRHDTFVDMIVGLTKAMHGEIESNFTKMDELRKKNPDNKKLGPLANKSAAQMRAADNIINGFGRYAGRSNRVVSKAVNKSNN